jgi:DNA topoisomerase-1
MRDRHINVNGSGLQFEFTGKGGKKHVIGVKDKRLARIVKQCRDLPGYDLFQYVGDDGERRTVSSSDVNAYLREISGQEFTAKDFRTWAGTVLAAMSLQEFEAVDSEAQAKRNVVAAIERVSERLGNTPAICRKCYVHPEVLDAYLGGDLASNLLTATREELGRMRGLRPEEGAVLAFLAQRLEGETKRKPKRASKPSKRAAAQAA